MTDNASFAGFQTVFSGGDEFNQIDFVVRSILARMGTAALVQVKKVTAMGEVAPVGLLDVQPLVAMVDGKNQATPHGIIHGLPYLRLQGGTNAVIIDPVVGDIGLAVFASRDISSVKATKAPGNPGSLRSFDMADGLYLGGFLNGAPERYIRFKSDGDIEIKPAAKVFIMGGVDITGDAHLTGTLTADTDVMGGGKSLLTHKHSGVTTGGGQSGPPV